MFQKPPIQPGRPTGVQTSPATSQLRHQTLPAKRVASMLPVEFFAIRYGNQDGEAHDALVMRAKLPDGSHDWYLPSDSESYAASLKQPVPWLRDELNKLFPLVSPDEEKTSSIPKDTGEI